MKRLHLFSLVLAATAMGLFSCSKTEIMPEAIPQEVLDRIALLGFSTENVIQDADDYIVEGDIRLSPEQLYSTPDWRRLPGEEQYHTFNLVTGMPRTITVYVDAGLPSYFVDAADEAISRYNAENLQITLQRVTGSSNTSGPGNAGNGNGGGKPGGGGGVNADITIKAAPRSAQYLASAGFPNASGDPYGQVQIATRYFSGNSRTDYIGTILAHEIGHCIGFRHTDWYNRSISCNSGGSEGQETSGVGAVHIPGTPSKDDNVDNRSFMLSCISNGTNRPFTSADKTALDCLYGAGTPCTR